MPRNSNLKIRALTHLTREEVCGLLGIRLDDLLTWESEFDFLLPHLNSKNAVYDWQEFDAVCRIQELLTQHGFSLAKVKILIAAENREVKGSKENLRDPSLRTQSPLLEKALMRIEISRQRYSAEESFGKQASGKLRSPEKLRLFIPGAKPISERIELFAGNIADLEKLPDITVVELANLHLSDSEQFALDALLEKNSGGVLTPSERKELDELMVLHNEALLVKAKALRIAVDRGLIEPLSD